MQSKLMSPMSGAAGALVTLAGQAVKALSQFLSLVILSRILTPEDFGVSAILLAICGVSILVSDLGLSIAAIQADHLTTDDKNHLFWTNAYIGICTAAAVVVVAIPVGHLYGSSRMTLMIQVLAVAFLFASMSSQHRAQLTRDRMVGRISAVDVTVSLATLIIAVVLANEGAGVWALVAQQSAIPALSFVGYVIMSPWQPGRPVLRLRVRRFLSLSAPAFVAQLVNYLGTALPALVLARFGGPSWAGQYNRGFQIYSLPTQQIATPLTRIAVDILRRAREAAKVLDTTANILKFMLLSVGTAMLGMVGLGNAIVHVLIGPGWTTAADCLRILAFGGLFQAINFVYYWSFLAAGKGALLLRCELPGRLLLMIGVVCAAPWGPVGCAAVVACGTIIITVTSTTIGIRQIGLSVRPLARKVWISCIPLGTSLASSVAISTGLGSRSPIAQLLAYIACVGLSLLAMMIVPICRQELLSLIAVVVPRLRQHKIESELPQ
ncbi:oligosaccharide flippase family protein [uncultured Gordonia sp.]|uniref:oligosaccharide flippase family protein n=1 Tax=uncultured Gordonia sp. TaxID=198437 RepID=UPI002590A876|nr:oligosaccharide flippase family protein [uncultured Gordonia sp.]